MERQQYSEPHRTEVLACLEQLVQQHRGVLLDLTASGILPTSLEHTLKVMGVREDELKEWFTRLQDGERPFEEWMRSQGHSEQQIAEIYQVIDQWLIDHGLIRPPKAPANQPLH